VLDLDPFGDQDDLDREVVESLSTAVRLGFDDVQKLKFAAEHTEILGRVQAHMAWANENDGLE
jgi:hypothetical protein